MELTRKAAKFKVSLDLFGKAIGLNGGNFKLGAVYRIIDDIFDNFENKVCQNCKHFNDKVCQNNKSYCYNNKISDNDKDKFGCTYFKQKNTKDKKWINTVGQTFNIYKT